LGTVDNSEQVVAKWFIRFWCLLLIPWIWVAPLAGMAFIAGNNLAVWILLVCIWAYPVVIVIAFRLRQQRPLTAALLPAFDLMLPFAVAAILDVLHVKYR
jgi:hypothetical protein